MAEASVAVYGAVIGVGIVLAVLAFSLRQRRPHGPEELMQGEEKAKETKIEEKAKETKIEEKAKETKIEEKAK